MLRRCGLASVMVALVLSVGAAAADKLALRLADQEFWALVTDLSEPGGSFRSDNLLSNESRLPARYP